MNLHPPSQPVSPGYAPGRIGPVEDDETQVEGFMREPMEYGTLVLDLQSGVPYTTSETLSHIDFQISTSDFPSGAGFMWSQDVLSALDSLPDFSAREAQVLVPIVGPPATSGPLRVRACLVSFQNKPDCYNHLRALTRQLKSAGRGDVVKALHKEKSALRWLGPILPEERPLKDIVPSLWVPLTTALSISHPTGHDWRLLAEYIQIPRQYIELWEQRERNPADFVLRHWQVKREATMGRLFDLLIDLDREDLATML